MYLNNVTIKEKVKLNRLQDVLIEKQKNYLTLEAQEQQYKKNEHDDTELIAKMQITVNEVDDAGKALNNYKARLKAEYQI
ncbi:MAG: hypothetical protein P0Y49_13595 [Candidatus Pedobacter colombiensis]|uniref:Uncharacterized protein n=1 Tax=Candidatus Pedobacter colombiensis TaxID=3121371 RepID=A0AAJ5W782_9SPHI|nr:hypothetical protein [Pedobacter sp.]WEK17832.1 MAG: hypothetical protein P0Y49_13595 [Pedobacter sp.]